jgi:NOL1/NOP2/fmu family ribosome biogenesis protein
VYSTCTYHVGENDDVVRWLVNEKGMEVQKLSVYGFEGIVETEFGYAFYPHRVRGEGFYLSVLRSTRGKTKMESAKKKGRLRPISPDFNFVKQWIKDDADTFFYQHNNTITGIPKGWTDKVEYLFQHLRIKYAGVEIASVKGSQAIPDHPLSMNWYLNKTVFPVNELTLKQALHYLRKETISISVPEKGLALVAFEGVPLGWIKNVGSRINNYYPVEWRIRMRSEG